MSWLAFVIYLVNIITNIDGIVTVYTIIGGVFVIIGGTLIKFAWGENSYKDQEMYDLYCKYHKIAVILWFISLGLSLILPSKNTMILMASVEIGQQVIQSEKVGKVVDKTVDNIVDPSVQLLRAWIEKETKEIQDSTVKSDHK